MRPDLARGVLTYLAATQATAVIRAEDAEPGKILHETCAGELAALHSTVRTYYGSVDATPLFVLLGGDYYGAPPTGAFSSELMPNIEPRSSGSGATATATATASSSMARSPTGW